MTQHPRDLTRDEQMASAIDVLREAREMGWAKVRVKVSRGGTYEVEAEVEGAKVARPSFASGLK